MSGHVILSFGLEVRSDNSRTQNWEAVGLMMSLAGKLANPEALYEIIVFFFFFNQYTGLVGIFYFLELKVV